MKPKIIATGLTGLVGSRVEELLSARFSFVSLGRPKFNLLDFNGLKRAFQAHPEVGVVLHLAAFTDVQAAWQERQDKTGQCYQVNVLGTRNIVNLCHQYQKYLIYISTDYVFDGKKDTPYIETDTPSPIEWYGQTKFLGEEEVQKRLVNFAIVRLASPFRAKFKPKLDLVRKIIKGLKEKSLPPMFTDQMTTLTFIDDIALGLAKFFDDRPDGIFHLVSSSYQSPYEMVLQVAEIFGFDRGLVKKGSLAEFEKKSSPKDRPWHHYLALSNKKVQSELGIKMRTLKEGLVEMKKQFQTAS